MKTKAINKSQPGRARAQTAVPKTEYVIEPGKQEMTSTTILDAPRELVAYLLEPKQAGTALKFFCR